MQALLNVLNRRLEADQFLRLVDLQVELFFIKEVKALHDRYIVDKLAKVVLRCPQTELIQADLLGSVVLQAVVESKRVLLECEPRVIRTYRQLAELLDREQLISAIRSLICQLNY